MDGCILVSSFRKTTAKQITPAELNHCLPLLPLRLARGKQTWLLD